jgi:hypothetical protein
MLIYYDILISNFYLLVWHHIVIIWCIQWLNQSTIFLNKNYMNVWYHQLLMFLKSLIHGKFSTTAKLLTNGKKIKFDIKEI